MHLAQHLVSHQKFPKYTILPNLLSSDTLQPVGIIVSNIMLAN
jgi:hypothetical protein